MEWLVQNSSCSHPICDRRGRANASGRRSGNRLGRRWRPVWNRAQGLALWRTFWPQSWDVPKAIESWSSDYRETRVEKTTFETNLPVHRRPQQVRAAELVSLESRENGPGLQELKIGLNHQAVSFCLHLLKKTRLPWGETSWKAKHLIREERWPMRWFTWPVWRV